MTSHMTLQAFYEIKIVGNRWCFPLKCLETFLHKSSFYCFILYCFFFYQSSSCKLVLSVILMDIFVLNLQIYLRAVTFNFYCIIIYFSVFFFHFYKNTIFQLEISILIFFMFLHVYQKCLDKPTKLIRRCCFFTESGQQNK